MSAVDSSAKGPVPLERIAGVFASDYEKSMKFPHLWGNALEMAKSKKKNMFPASV